MSIQKKKKKLYYSLRQTASMTGLSVAVLKNWEKEFPEVQPARNRAGLILERRDDADLEGLQRGR